METKNTLQKQRRIVFLPASKVVLLLAVFSVLMNGGCKKDSSTPTPAPTPAPTPPAVAFKALISGPNAPYNNDSINVVPTLINYNVSNYYTYEYTATYTGSNPSSSYNYQNITIYFPGILYSDPQIGSWTIGGNTFGNSNANCNYEVGNNSSSYASYSSQNSNGTLVISNVNTTYKTFTGTFQVTDLEVGYNGSGPSVTISGSFANLPY